MNLFYSTEINPDILHFTLPEEESFHAIRVLRMKKGDKLFLTDGKGMFYELEITNPHPKKCETKVIRSIPDTARGNLAAGQAGFHLTIAIAPTKSMDRFEWFLEKVTEIGCDEIIPIQCRHSERTVIKTERLKKVLVSAMKQCLKSQLPKLHEMVELKKFITSPRTPLLEQGKGKRFIGHIPELGETEFPPQHPRGKSLQSIYKKGENVLIAIGPEGGFSEEEVALAIQNNFTMISLGTSRLRVETAGVVACSVINAINS